MPVTCFSTGNTINYTSAKHEATLSLQNGAKPMAAYVPPKTSRLRQVKLDNAMSHAPFMMAVVNVII